MSTYPTVRPSLTLDFQKSKQLDPRIAFSRSSTATYVEGGLVKYAYTDQARFEEEGLLVEESRTNLLPESGNLNDQTYWHTFTNPGSLNQAANAGWMVATANTTEVVSPDGTNNACKLSGKTPSTFDKNYKVHVVPERTSVPMSANVVYSWTLFVKDPDSVFNGDNLLTFMYGSRFSNTNASVRFDLSNDTVTYAGDIANESASITSYPNGWKKLTATWTNTSSSGGPRYYLEELSPRTNSVTQFSANGEKFYVWGFQIEEGAFPTSYIPTAGSTVTRAADVLQITGDNFSSWYNPSQGSLFGEYVANGGFGTFRIWDGAGNNLNYWQIGADATASGVMGLGTRSNQGASTTDDFPGRIDAQTNYGFKVRHAAGISVGESSCYTFSSSGDSNLNTGGPINVDDYVAPLVDRFEVHDLEGSINIARLSYYPERLTDTQLEAIAS